MDATDMLKNSIIVAAHPDDEALWFSSIVGKVDRVVICSWGVTDGPESRGAGAQCLAEHPIKNIRCFGIEYSGTFDSVNWRKPRITPYGLEILDKEHSRRYVASYYALKDNLTRELAGYRNVYTHNPWGEYGHPEHVQVYRVVRELQEILKFNLWYSNYVSNRNFNFMLDQVKRIRLTRVALKTDKTLGESCKSLYRLHGCWTWYDDWEWPDEEYFLRDDPDDLRSALSQSIPLNLTKVHFRVAPETPYERARRTLRRWINPLRKPSPT